MARRFRNFRANVVRSGRKTFWFAGLHQRTTLAAASTAAIVSSLNAAALALRPFTIVRTRGYMSLVSDIQSAVENQSASYGGIVVSDQAVAIGVTAVPTPTTDSQSDWFFYEALNDKLQFITGVGFQSRSLVRQLIDSKAMRKVEEGQDVITVAETSAISDGAVVGSFTRILIKLH